MSYIPDRGDIAWVNFDPIRGHEQGGKRPAFVVSSRVYNGKSHMALICPITSKAKNYPFEVPIAINKIKGVILTDQVRNVDWVNRKVEFVGKVDVEIIKMVQDRLVRLIE